MFGKDAEFYQNRTRLECKAKNYKTAASKRFNIRIEPDWNVKGVNI